MSEATDTPGTTSAQREPSASGEDPRELSALGASGQPPEGAPGEGPAGEPPAAEPPAIEQPLPPAQSPPEAFHLTPPPAQRSRGRAAAKPPAVEQALAADAGEAGIANAYQVHLPAFEGPLDLLLHLINEHKLDILDIPIAFVSQKYVEYIMLMQDLNIDLASEYLVMAATLAHIKSKMLLPAPPEGQDDEPGEELDPRAELVRRLLEYQKYKHASESLLGAPVLGRDVFLRGPTAEHVEGEAPLAPVSVFKLLDAFQRLLSRVKQTADHLIDVDRISISERILQLVDLLEGRGPTVFDELFVGEISKADLVVTFLALLEMTRLRMMQVLQAGPLSPLHVELTLSDEQHQVLKRDVGESDPLANLLGGSDGPPPAPEPEPEEFD